ncbi:MAG: hypothetical protein QNJ70_10695 [Xenococcaceae cyanobacterium MO_207.B15]|nr:hypothetical protein [Xenococcaceae cyanobacterium MO_207.B15]MDJ0745982.1 hypothetical protein [Xenococcaceae cyanobacterium MO_167.B27]
MNQSAQENLTAKALEKTIKASIKKEIVAKGINTTTRQGNKELKFLASKIARYPFDNLEQAKIAGEKLGQHLSELLQQRNKQNLDGSLIQKIAYQKDLWSLAGLSKPHLTKTANNNNDSSQKPAIETEQIQSTDEVTAISSTEAEEISATDTAAPEAQDQNSMEERADETGTTDVT